MPLGKTLHLRLFLEGQEVPVISAQVQAGIWSPAVASIQVVPLDEALELKPRTMVHLFFLEEPLYNVAHPTADLSKMRTVDDEGSPLDTELSDTAYKLLFTGEVVGFSFVKTPMSRAVILQCVDFTSYWDQLQATMLDYGPQGNAFVHKASLYASDESLFAALPNMTAQQRLASWIQSKPQTPGLKNVKGLAGGIIAMMEIMGGLRGKRLGVNDFFTLAELRCHILNQVCAEDGDSTAARLLDHTVFMEWLQNNLQGGGGQLSLRDMFKLLCQYVFYSVVPNPAAKYDGEQSNLQQKVAPKTTKLSESRYFGLIHEAVTDIRRDLNNDTITKEKVDALYNRARTQVTPNLKSDKISGLPPTLPPQAAILEQRLKQFVEGFTTSGADWREVQRRFGYDEANRLLTTINEAGETKVTTKGYVTSVDIAAHLKTTIFRPECFMSAPPVCNVIFPEQYSQIAYDRGFLNEVTRVEVSVHSWLASRGNPPPDPNKSSLLSQHILQPDLHDMSIEVAKKLKNKWRVLMDHEHHTGIIAKEEWLPDSFSTGSLRAGSSSETQQKIKSAGLTWAQKTGLYHFFKYRIGPRTLNGSGRFNPYLVAGFPALVIQKPFYVTGEENNILDRLRRSPNPALEFADQPNGCPPQFLGMIEGLTHHVSQDGGQTSFSLSHCRSHLGIDDEFVGKVLDRVKTNKYKTTLVRTRITYQEAIKNEKLLGILRNCTPQGGSAPTTQPLCTREQTTNDTSFQVKSMDGGQEKIVTKNVSVPVLSEKIQNKENSPDLLGTSPNPFGAAGETMQVPNPPGQLTVGSKGPKGGKVRLVQVLAPYTYQDFFGARYYTAVMIHEDVNVPYDPNADPRVPVEYVVQPSWLSPSYDNDQVGKKIYQPFFGCQSIVDQIMTGDFASIPPRTPEDGLDSLSDEDEKSLRDRLKKIDQKRALLSIETAVNFIAYLYGKVKSEGLDVEEFIQSFTRRPIATKADILGTHDLALRVVGTDFEVLNGKLGFHTLSVHPDVVNAGNLTGLLNNPAMVMARMDRDEKTAMAASYDVRWEKLNRVQLYLDILANGTRAFGG